MFKWIRSFTDQRICKIKFGNSLSKCYNLQTGLPQGAVGSCSFFNLYINDLVSALKTVKDVDCSLFADDLVIWTQAPKVNAKSLIENEINKALDILSDWCIKNNMTVNLEKTATQTFSLAHQTLLPDLKYRDVALIHSNKFNYLGVTFYNKLNWKSHIESTSNRFLKRVYILKRLAGSLWGCDRSTLNVTYKTFIQPSITYYCEPLIAEMRKYCKN
ncbi:uncharacterized protein CEXT_278811 [Caerostris extrusa]|uniref:Reverse transcriptase domain-containing protein n=1 Tax=Caerostris extrusa TaxID=172846 RepID=A0AAV4M6R0_CAEEX|nr:uncharacterized protein CEXT_278811 [Caerostris extrusa]